MVRSVKDFFQFFPRAKLARIVSVLPFLHLPKLWLIEKDLKACLPRWEVDMCLLLTQGAAMQDAMGVCLQENEGLHFVGLQLHTHSIQII